MPQTERCRLSAAKIVQRASSSALDDLNNDTLLCIMSFLPVEEVLQCAITVFARLITCSKLYTREERARCNGVTFLNTPLDQSAFNRKVGRGVLHFLSRILSNSRELSMSELLAVGAKPLTFAWIRADVMTRIT